MKLTFKIFVILAILLALCLNYSGQALSSLPDNPIPATTQTNHLVYLPFVNRGDTTPPTSITLIDRAVSSGEISAEQGLIYKTFAVWGDPRLPVQYKGAPEENAGDGVMRAIAEQGDGLSEEARLTLSPFFLPPTDPESWWNLQHAADANQVIVADTWQAVSSAGGKIKVWYFSGEADAARQAGVVKNALDGKIWSNETTLMGREPKYGTSEMSVINIYLWHSYVKSDGTIVPFNGTRGATLSQSCRNTPSWIYINNNRPDGDEFTPGMIQTVTHELFHAFQNSYNMLSCPSYDWLAEATAKWVEDYVYPDADSEWPYASSYLDSPNVRLDDQTDNHHYGAYLLPYYLTHQFDDPAIVRKMWENSEAYDNSYLAVKYALPANYQDIFWASFLLTLWNKTPYPTFFQTYDEFTEVVKPEWSAAVPVSTSEHEYIKEMSGDLPTGAVRYYHFTFPDSSVRSLAFLNGLTFNMRKDSLWNSQYGSEFSVEADQTYASDPLSDEEQQGIVMFAMYKAVGKTTWDFLPISADEKSYCADTQGKIEDLVVVLSNGDFDHPDRVVKPLGLNTMLYANNMPCAQYQGTSRIALYNDGVTTTYSAVNIVYKSFSTDTISDMTFPYVYFALQSASVNWSISGTDSVGCTYSGSGNFSVDPHPGAGTDQIVLYSGVLVGSPSYRAYHGFGSPNEGETITYTYTCDGTSTEASKEAYFFLEIPIDQDRENLMIGADGALVGSYRLAETGDDWTEYEWNLSPGP